MIKGAVYYGEHKNDVVARNAVLALETCDITTEKVGRVNTYHGGFLWLHNYLDDWESLSGAAWLRPTVVSR